MGLLCTHSNLNGRRAGFILSQWRPDSPRRITTLSYSLYKRPETQLSWDGKV